MKNYTKVFISFILIISSILFVTFIWDKICFSYKNPLEIIGEYSKQSYNPINDAVRYLLFIFFPLLIAGSIGMVFSFIFFVSFLSKTCIFPKKYQVELFQIDPNCLRKCFFYH
jgi:hypothetical protein